MISFRLRSNALEVSKTNAEKKEATKKAMGQHCAMVFGEWCSKIFFRIVLFKAVGFLYSKTTFAAVL